MHEARTTRLLRAARAAALGCLCALIAGLAPAASQGLDLRLADTIERPAGKAAAEEPAAGGYRIDSGDRVSITVYDEPDLSISDVRVRDSGAIAFPLLGELRIRGMTADEVKRKVTERLADGYLRKPSVSVSVDRYRLYFIRGEVARPGGYSYVDGLTVEKAVALAGGFTDRAAESDITLIRESAPDKPVERIELHTPIHPGDVLKVGESFF